MTVAPRASRTFWSFSASSLGRFSFRTLGTDSANFFACERNQRGPASGQLRHRWDGTRRKKRGGKREELWEGSEGKGETRTSIKFMLGIRFLISLMIFGLLAASNFSSVTLKMVFSFGFSCTTSRKPSQDTCFWVKREARGRKGGVSAILTSTAAASSTGAAAATGAGPVGIAISWIFSRV